MAKLNHNYYRSSREGSKSMYKGVIRRGEGKFEAQIRINKKFKYLGLYNSEKKAAQAYNDAVDKYLNGEGFKNDLSENRSGNLREEKVYEQIYETNNYQLFDFFIENRTLDINDSHVKRLVRSIKEGYELPPILVNEAGIIIDGQHRYAAWMHLNMPIRYFIGKYQGRKQLGLMNGSGQKHWTIKDHVQSISVKNDDYKVLLDYYSHSNLGFRELAYLLQGTYMEYPRIKEGHFKLDKKRKETADKFLRIYDRKFDGIPGRSLKFAIFKLWELGNVDVNRLASICRTRNAEIKMLKNYSDVMAYIVEEYNYNQKKYKFEITYTKKGDKVFSFTS